MGNIIPANLTDGVSIAPVPQGGATLSEGKTKPPKPFTEATLLAAMEHASRWVEDKDLKAPWTTTNPIPEASARRPPAPT